MGKGGPKFKELRVWQKGKDLAVYIYQITNIKYALKIDIGTLENLSPLAICLLPFFTLLCIPFVLIPPLNEISPIRVTATPSVISDEWWVTCHRLQITYYRPQGAAGSLPTRVLFNRYLIPKKRRFRWNRTNSTQLRIEYCNYPLIGFSVELHTVWDSIIAYSYRSVGIYDCTCFRCVCKEKQDSRRG